MPYDLYGTYYKYAREAEAAEMAQVNDIDNRILQKKVERLERIQTQPDAEIWQYINMLENRIKELEKIVIRDI